MEPLVTPVVAQEKSNPDRRGVFTRSTDIQAHPKTIHSLVAKSQECLLEIHSIFPLDMFPDRLMVDMSKVVIAYRDFLGIGTEHTILLNEIRDVDVDLSLITANLQFLVSGPGVIWTGIKNLHKHEAMRAKHLIEGLLIAKAEQADFQNISLQERIDMLVLLGKGANR